MVIIRVGEKFLKEETTVELPYASKTLELKLPRRNVSYVVDVGKALAVEDPHEEVKRALRNPIAHPGIKKSVKKGDKVVILGDDISRPTPCDKLIPPILSELNDAGIPDKDITIIVSPGTHRAMTEEEFRIKFGEEAVRRVKIKNHNFKDKNELVYMGITPLGTPIWVNKEFYEADFKIGLGNIVPHPFGWGGGGKIVEPGICGAETTYKVHRLGASYRIQDLIGDIENPVRREIDEVAVKAGLNMIVNTIIDAKKQLISVVAGDVVKAHREGVRRAETLYRPKVPYRADIAIVGSPGFDVNIDYYQAIKGVLAASCFVKEGGTIIAASPCYEGIPLKDHPEVLKLGRLSYEEALKALDAGDYADPSLPGFLSIHTQLKAFAEIVVYSDGLTEEDCKILGLKKTLSLEDAINTALKKHGNKATIGILKHFEVFPQVIS
jgi:nickel-dependent lactate racemase